MLKKQPKSAAFFGKNEKNLKWKKFLALANFYAKKLRFL